MRNLFGYYVRLAGLCLILASVVPSFVFGQSDNTWKTDLKYGKPSKEELSWTTYAPDTSAAAVCLFHLGNTEYVYVDKFSVATEHQVRIKILKPEGLDYAQVEIPFYAPEGKEEEEGERVGDVEGCTYTLQNGKIKKTKLKKSMVSEERKDPYYKVVKLSLPEVQVGSVIEYSYKVEYNEYTRIDNWMMQQEIPVVYSGYEVAIPEVFIYNVEYRGRDRINVEESNGNLRATWYVVSGLSREAKYFSFATRNLKFTSENLPAIRQNEDFCWCPDIYRVQISFDLQGTNFHYLKGSNLRDEGYRPYGKNWGDVDQRLKESERFGQMLSLRNPYREEIQQLNSTYTGFEEKAIAAFNLLKSHLTWNGEYALYCGDMDQVVKEGKGTNADLNFVLIRILADLGIKAYPTVMSRRSLGILPATFPSLHKLNTFVVALYNPQKKAYSFLDSSMEVPALNVLPVELLTDRARILYTSDAEKDKWVNLMNLSNNSVNISLNAKMAGTAIEGSRTVSLNGQEAAAYWAIRQKGDTTSCWNPAGEKMDGVEIASLKATPGKNDFSAVKEEMNFALKASQEGDRLVVNPMLFPLQTENPYVQPDRALPVEFPYPYRVNMLCLLTLPEGYEVETMPASATLKTEDDKLLCKYLIQRTGNSVSLNYTFELKTSVLSNTDYSKLQEVMSKAVEMNQAKIVLKKKAE